MAAPAYTRGPLTRDCPHPEALLRKDGRGYIFCPECKRAGALRGAAARSLARSAVTPPPPRAHPVEIHANTFDVWAALRPEPAGDAAPALSPLFGDRALLEMQRTMGGRHG